MDPHVSVMVAAGPRARVLLHCRLTLLCVFALAAAGKGYDACCPACATP